MQYVVSAVGDAMVGGACCQGRSAGGNAMEGGAGGGGGGDAIAGGAWKQGEEGGRYVVSAEGNAMVRAVVVPAGYIQCAVHTASVAAAVVTTVTPC